jgi:hypothetical protein
MKFFKRKKIITRMEGGQLVPYLVRWNLFECSLFSIKIHKILVSDDDCMHDHPWAFISFILKGGYVEQTVKHPEVLEFENSVLTYYKKTGIPEFLREKKTYGAGSILFRPAHFVHRLEINQPATTLVITFRKIRPWGFYTPRGWIDGLIYKKSEHCE